MKSVLMSIQPKWCELIANGKKTIEVRKTKPKLETPFKVYIYCTNDKDMLWILKESERRRKIASIFTAKDVGGATKANGKVIGEFVCDSIRKISCTNNNEGVWLKSTAGEFILGMSALTHDEISSYLENSSGYAWHISNLVIYDEPRELREFCKVGVCPCDAKSILHCTENMSFCAKRNLIIAPQSWCYVESEV